MHSNKEKILSMLFIVGRGRSGSTLLTSLLNNHPQIIAPEESRFVQELYYQFSGTKEWTEAKKEKFCKALFSCFESLDIDKKKLENLIFSLDTNVSFPKMLQTVYLSVKQLNNKEDVRVIVDKNPKYSFFIPKLRQIFPEAKFIHLTRDYRDSYLSFKKIKGMKGERKKLSFQIFRWRYYHRSILKAKSSIPDSFYLHVKYEDLVNDTEGFMRKVADFVGVDYKNELLKIQQIQREGVRAEIHQSLNKEINTSKIDKWKKEMSQKEIKLANAIAGKLAMQFNYEKEASRLGLLVFIQTFPMRIIALSPLFFRKVLFRFSFLMRIFYSLKKSLKKLI
jgi:LPS sulfotransferase NodH